MALFYSDLFSPHFAHLVHIKHLIVTPAAHFLWWRFCTVLLRCHKFSECLHCSSNSVAPNALSSYYIRRLFGQNRHSTKSKHDDREIWIWMLFDALCWEFLRLKVEFIAVRQAQISVEWDLLRTCSIFRSPRSEVWLHEELVHFVLRTKRRYRAGWLGDVLTRCKGKMLLHCTFKTMIEGFCSCFICSHYLWLCFPLCEI